ncbi:MAG TPA: glycosyltransferase family 4 protein [Candidatus Saccharimonadales bacterium]|nr:glycosyltransferase family 4 protein [Candidatus Saccharimonadales bacterium]
MKFLILTQYFAPEIGASQVRLAYLCRELAAAGHKVEIVTGMPHHHADRIFPEYRGQFLLDGEWEGLKVHRTWLYASSGSNLKRLLSYATFAGTCLFGMAKSEKPDYVFVDSPPIFVGVPGWIAAKLWDVPLIFNVADLWPDSVRDLGVMRDGFLMKIAFGLERWIYRHSSVVTAVTEGIRESLLNTKGIPPEKVLFLPNGVDTRLFRPSASDDSLKKKLGLSDKKIILYAGNHGYAGAVEQILYAAESLRHQSSYHFLFLGEGPEKPKLIELSVKLGLTNVTFHNEVPLSEVPAFVAISDMGVVTLRKSQVMAGARPAKAFVMMAGGKPVVMAAEGEAARLIQTAGAGIVVPPENHGLLANAIRTVLQNPEVASQMGAAGRKFVVSNFQWSLLVRNWIAQLSNISILAARSKGDENHAERETRARLSND